MLFSKPKEEEVSGQLEIDLIMSMVKAVNKTVLQKFEISFKEKPKIDKKTVVTWQGKMKIVKPSDCVFISVIVIQRPKVKDNGIFVLYLPESIAETIAVRFGAKRADGEVGLLKACGDFLIEVTNYFKEYMLKLGYEDLKFSSPMNFTSKVDQLFDFYQSTKFQVTFVHEGEKFLEFDVGIGPLKKSAIPAAGTNP
jgi:hypothetical protein